MLNKKRILIILFIIIILGLLITGVYFFINNDRNIPFIEYVPEEEISDEQLRQTKLTLYFKNGENIVPEIRKIDVKQLLDPYMTVINMLIEGPKNNNFEKIIPEGTKINNIKKEKDMLIVDFSNELIDNIKQESDKKLIIKSIVNSLTEYVEINKIKILINGDENTFNNIYEKENIN